MFVPNWFLGLGLCFLTSAAGVYLRDVGHATAIATQLLLFLSPIFYSVSMIPRAYQIALMANPLTFIVEQARAVMIQGVAPDFLMLGIFSLGTMAFAALSFAWFQRVREGFADVL